MPLYQHRFTGHTAMGESFMYSWWANSIRDIATAQAAAVAWNAALWNGPGGVNGYKTKVTAAVGMDNVTTLLVTQSSGQQTARVDTPQVIVGTAAGSALPGDVSLVISLRTALANRSGRGRFYLPQPAASQVATDGRVLAAMITDVMAALAPAWTAYDTGVDRPVIYSRTLRQVNNIVTYNVGNLFDTQRRRENKIVEVRTSANMP